jgi:CRP-like cAMP-binding protein
MSYIHSDLVKDLSAEEAAPLMALGVPTSVPRGTVLFHVGEPADSVFLVLRGRVTLTLPIQIHGADQDVEVEEKVAGETLGWSGFIPPHRFTLKATAVVDSDLLAFSRDALTAHFAAQPAVGFTVTRNIASVIGHRLAVFQTMWLREMQRVVELRYS